MITFAFAFLLNYIYCHTHKLFLANSHPDSALNIRKWKDVGALLLAHPTPGLSHRLDQDKQLEIAHAVRYYTNLPWKNT